MSTRFYRAYRNDGTNALLCQPEGFPEGKVVPFSGAVWVPKDFDGEVWDKYGTVDIDHYEKMYNVVEVDINDKPLVEGEEEVPTNNSIFDDVEGTVWVLCGRTGRFYPFAHFDKPMVTENFEGGIYATLTPDLPLRRIG